MIMVYIPCRNREEGRAIARDLLERRLAGSINMFPIESMYWWQGQIVDDSEYVILVKTVESHYQAIEDHVKRIHTYEVPAIISVRVSNVDNRYLAWLEAETQVPDTG